MWLYHYDTEPVYEDGEFGGTLRVEEHQRIAPNDLRRSESSANGTRPRRESQLLRQRLEGWPKASLAQRDRSEAEPWKARCPAASDAAGQTPIIPIKIFQMNLKN